MMQLKQYLKKLPSNVRNRRIVHKIQSREGLLMSITLREGSRKPEVDHKKEKMCPPSGKLRRHTELYGN